MRGTAANTPAPSLLHCWGAVERSGTWAGWVVPEVRCTGPVPPPRLHPVAVTLQRYTTQEVTLQHYRIPPKVSTGSLLIPTRSAWGSGWVEEGPGAWMGDIHWGWIPAPQAPVKPHREPRPTGLILPPCRRWCRSVSTPWAGIPRCSRSRSSSSRSAGWGLTPSTSRGWALVSAPGSAWGAGSRSWRCRSSSCR